MSKFGLLHTALYAKHHYRREYRQSIWDDLKIMLTLDGYAGDCFNNYEIARIILAACQRHLQILPFQDLLTFANGISKENCWRVGYYTEDSPFRETDAKYDMNEAIVRYCLSGLVGCEIALICPDGNMPMANHTRKGLSRPFKNK